jgi:hypothetical protein
MKQIANSVKEAIQKEKAITDEKILKLTSDLLQK